MRKTALVLLLSILLQSKRMFTTAALRSSYRMSRGQYNMSSRMIAGQYQVFDQNIGQIPDPPKGEHVVEDQHHIYSSAKVVTKQPNGTNGKGPVIVGIAGGSASGKTTLARAIIKSLGKQHVSFIGHDSYYKELSHIPLKARAEVNFDHPNALDTSLLVQHIMQLKSGEAVNVPIYDFATHTRTEKTELISPRPIIILDGILIFAEPELLSLMDMKIFVDTEDDLRLIRRIKRDITERQRSIESVMSQYTKTVRPMHLLYVEPSKRGADIIVPAGQGIQEVALDMCVSRLREIINLHK